MPVWQLVPGLVLMGLTAYLFLSLAARLFHTEPPLSVDDLELDSALQLLKKL